MLFLPSQIRINIFPFFANQEATASETELTVTLTEFRSANMTFACEVQTLRDNGYGKLRHNKKLGESTVRVRERSPFPQKVQSKFLKV